MFGGIAVVSINFVLFIDVYVEYNSVYSYESANDQL